MIKCHAVFQFQLTVNDLKAIIRHGKFERFASIKVNHIQATNHRAFLIFIN